MLITDAHLDLGYNVMRGRDVTRPAAEQPDVVTDFVEVASVGLPDLRAGGVGLICGVIFCLPDEPRERGYRSADEANAMAWEQIEWYRRQHEAGQMRIVASRDGLPPGDPPDMAPADPVPAILLLEGADPIRDEQDLTRFHAAGVRIVGLAWHATTHAGGTGHPGPLTDLGRATVRAMDRLGMIHDASHLAEESFWQLVDLSPGPIIASHSNCRAIVPGDRQLSDEMIKAIVARDGVIGINFFYRFLVAPDERNTRPCTLEDVLRHVRHICDLAGDARYVGLGTDMDGGLGRDQIPREITTSADLPRVADALSHAGFGDEDVRHIMGLNWRRYFATHLPASFE